MVKSDRVETMGCILLEIVNRHVLELDLLGTIDVGSIGENAKRHAGAGNIGKSIRDEYISSSPTNRRT